MTAPAHTRAVAFLCRAGLVAAVLALIAGIFGMHIMTGTHSMHSPAATQAATAVTAHGPSSGDNHMGQHATGPSSARVAAGVQEAAGTSAGQCSEAGGCTSMQAMTAACTPSAKTGSLAAPQPGTGMISVNINTGALSTITDRWSYLPGSPSPGELCISRT